MKKHFAKTLFVTIFMLFIIAISAFAGTADIQFGDPTTTRGKTFDLVVKVKSKDVALSTADITIAYDANKLEFVSGNDCEGGAGLVRINGKGSGSGTTTLQYKLKFNAISAGKTQITLQTYEVTDKNDNPVNIEHKGSSNVNIKSASTTSKNANLKSLDVQPGELQGEFDPNIQEYTCEVNNDVEQIAINAYPEDSDAKVEVKGNDILNTGENIVEINVVAPNNTTKKTYVVRVNKLETGVTPGGQSTIDGQRIISEKYYVTYMDFPEDVNVLDGYVETTAYIFNNELKVWVEKNNNDPQYCIFYGMDQNGDTGFYRYDKYKYTVQRYFKDPDTDALRLQAKNEAEAVSKYNSLKDKYNILLIASVFLGIIGIILIIIIIVVLIKKGSSNNKTDFGKKDDYGYDDEEEEDDDEFFAKRPEAINRTRKDKPIEQSEDDFFAKRSNSVNEKQNDDYVEDEEYINENDEFIEDNDGEEDIAKIDDVKSNIEKEDMEIEDLD